MFSSSQQIEETDFHACGEFPKSFGHCSVSYWLNGSHWLTFLQTIHPNLCLRNRIQHRHQTF